MEEVEAFFISTTNKFSYFHRFLSCFKDSSVKFLHEKQIIIIVSLFGDVLTFDNITFIIMFK